jgi:type 1 glutamine amidotransferase
MPSRLLSSAFLCVCAILFSLSDANAADPPKKIVLIAGKKSHGPVGNGIHDYPWSVKLLKVMLDNSNVADRVRVEYHLDGWPEDPSTFDDADTIMVVSDGRDGDKYEEAPHFQSDERAALIQKQIDRGCGFVTFHFSTFAPDKYARQSLEWTGGYFDWEENGERQWYSAIEVHETEVVPATPEHPVLRDVGAFTMKEEFYFNIRFAESAEGTTPIWTVPVLPGREPDGKVVAWAKVRNGGGRGFGTTCGHFYANWEQPEFRKLILNALVWTAGVDVPEGGVEARYYTHEEITAALTRRAGSRLPEPAPVSNPAGGGLSYDDKPIRVLIVAGNEAHKWHNWEKTTPAIKTQLEIDPRITVDVSHDIEDLARKDLAVYDVIVQNSYANWHDPTPLSEAARTAFVNFLQRGGGLVLIHFANGAWHFSLPMAGASDWPEYRQIVRRVWNHKGEGEARSGHDSFGPFTVKITPVEDPITSGLHDFDITDELYFRQVGTEPIEPLIAAHSKITNREEPLAWKYTYGKGRVFQTLLGHSEQTYEAFEACEMLRRAAAWCAGSNVREFPRTSASSK